MTGSSVALDCSTRDDRTVLVLDRSDQPVRESSASTRLARSLGENGLVM